jgi:hypothetical protein
VITIWPTLSLREGKKIGYCSRPRKVPIITPLTAVRGRHNQSKPNILWECCSHVVAISVYFLPKQTVAKIKTKRGCFHPRVGFTPLFENIFFSWPFYLSLDLISPIELFISPIELLNLSTGSWSHHCFKKSSRKFKVFNVWGSQRGVLTVIFIPSTVNLSKPLETIARLNYLVSSAPFLPNLNIWP